MDKSELLRRMREGRAEFEGLLARVPPEQMTPPNLDNNWSVKDMLAHTAFWAQRAYNLYHILVRGETPDSIGDDNVDTVNAGVYAENKDKPLAEVVAWERKAYAELLALTETMPESDLFDGKRFAWTEGEEFCNWIVNNTYGHYEEHIPALKKWLG